MKLIQFGGLDASHLNALTQLVDRCQHEDKASVRIYWNLISKPRAIPGDLCLFNKDNQLIAYLGFFHFNTDEAEITVLVDPAWRQMGCFNTLLARAMELYNALELKKLLFCCPAQNPVTEKILKRRQAKLRLSEYDLHWDQTTQLTKPLNPSYQKRLASFADLDQLVQLDALCLGGEQDKIHYHFTANLRESNRQTWMLYDQVHFVGKIHLHFQEDAVFIHNICIRPEYQGQGYGFYFLSEILCDLASQGYTQIKMEVEALNDRAISLYLKLGFKISAHYEFWEKETAKKY